MKNRFEIGQAFETEIVAITDNTIFLDLSAKSEGVLDKAELADENGEVSVKEGDKINNIRYYRKQARLTQLELADKLNVARSAVTHWEKGTFQPNKEHIRKMARVLKCKKDELMGGDDS